MRLGYASRKPGHISKTEKGLLKADWKYLRVKTTKTYPYEAPSIDDCVVIIDHGTHSDIQVDPQTRHDKKASKDHTRQHETLGNRTKTHFDPGESRFVEMTTIFRVLKFTMPSPCRRKADEVGKSITSLVCRLPRRFDSQYKAHGLTLRALGLQVLGPCRGSFRRGESNRQFCCAQIKASHILCSEGRNYPVWTGWTGGRVGITRWIYKLWFEQVIRLTNKIRSTQFILNCTKQRRRRTRCSHVHIFGRVI